MKNIVGLDLGTNSIGWAVVNGSVNGELLNSVVVENFNIEDYKKVEVPPVIPENISVSDNNTSDKE